MLQGHKKSLFIHCLHINILLRVFFCELKEVCSYSYTKRGIVRLYCGDIKSDSGDSFVEKEAVLLKFHLVFARVTFHRSIEPVLSSGFACSLSSHSAIFRFFILLGFNSCQGKQEKILRFNLSMIQPCSLLLLLYNLTVLGDKYCMQDI